MLNLTVVRRGVFVLDDIVGTLGGIPAVSFCIRVFSWYANVKFAVYDSGLSRK